MYREQLFECGAKIARSPSEQIAFGSNWVEAKAQPHRHQRGVTDRPYRHIFDREGPVQRWLEDRESGRFASEARYV
jgi:hypothetical protein